MTDVGTVMPAAFAFGVGAGADFQPYSGLRGFECAFDFAYMYGRTRGDEYKTQILTKCLQHFRVITFSIQIQLTSQ